MQNNEHDGYLWRPFHQISGRQREHDHSFLYMVTVTCCARRSVVEPRVRGSGINTMDKEPGSRTSLLF